MLAQDQRAENFGRVEDQDRYQEPGRVCLVDHRPSGLRVVDQGGTPGVLTVSERWEGVRDGATRMVRVASSWAQKGDVIGFYGLGSRSRD